VEIRINAREARVPRGGHEAIGHPVGPATGYVRALFLGVPARRDFARNKKRTALLSRAAQGKPGTFSVPRPSAVREIVVARWPRGPSRTIERVLDSCTIRRCRGGPVRGLTD